MKRRNFIKNTGLGAISIPFLNGISFQSLAASPFQKLLTTVSNPDRILVVVQMNGGNDGLNTLIPISEYSHLSQSNSNGGRSNILIDENEVLKLVYNSVNQHPGTGLHPAMTGFSNLFSNGQLAVLQGVGYPNPSFSHFRATDIWLSGSDSNVYWDTGWAGRFIEHEHPNYSSNLPQDPVAITVGAISSTAYNGSEQNMGLAVQDPTSTGYFSGNTDVAPNSLYGYELENIRKVIQQSDDFSNRLTTAFNNGSNVANYPTDNALAQQLKTVARLIKGDLQSNFYLVNIGSFDTHDSQVNNGDVKTGWHADNLGKLADAINIFMQDINSMSNANGLMGDQVLGLTFSEFGRTIKSNDTSGTDHGTTGPMFMFGNHVQTSVIGENPSIYDNANNRIKSDLDMQFDFRSVYASIFHEWFGMNKTDIDGLFGKTFEDGTAPNQDIYDGGFHCNLPILKGMPIPLEPETAINENQKTNFDFHPNPSTGKVKFVGLDNSSYSVNIISNDGKLLHNSQYSGQELQNGVNFNLSRGYYTISVQNQAKNFVESKRLMVQ